MKVRRSLGSEAHNGGSLVRRRKGLKVLCRPSPALSRNGKIDLSSPTTRLQCLFVYHLSRTKGPSTKQSVVRRRFALSLARQMAGFFVLNRPVPWLEASNQFATIRILRRKMNATVSLEWPSLVRLSGRRYLPCCL